MDETLILASVDHKWCTNGRLVRDEDGREFPPPPPHRRLQTCQTAHSLHEEGTCAQPFSALSRARATLPVVARRTSRGIRSRGSGPRSSPRRARVELQVARPADARARAGDRPTEARKARGKHNASDANIHHEHVRAQGGDEGASPALRFVQRPQEEWQWCHRVRCAARNPRSLDVRSRGRVNTHRHLSAAVEEKGLGKTHVSIFRAFDAALTRAASLEIPSRHPLRRAKSDIRSRPVDVASPIPRKPSPTPPSPCSVSHAD